MMTRAQALTILANPNSSYLLKQQAIAFLSGMGFKR